MVYIVPADLTRYHSLGQSKKDYLFSFSDSDILIFYRVSPLQQISSGTAGHVYPSDDNDDYKAGQAIHHYIGHRPVSSLLQRIFFEILLIFWNFFNLSILIFRPGPIRIIGHIILLPFGGLGVC